MPNSLIAQAKEARKKADEAETAWRAAKDEARDLAREAEKLEEKARAKSDG